ATRVLRSEATRGVCGFGRGVKSAARCRPALKGRPGQTSTVNRAAQRRSVLGGCVFSPVDGACLSRPAIYGRPAPRRRFRPRNCCQARHLIASRFSFTPLRRRGRLRRSPRDDDPPTASTAMRIVLIIARVLVLLLALFGAGGSAALGSILYAAVKL